jgi:hypothetical protein
MEQREQLGRAAAQIFVVLLRGLAFCLPRFADTRHGLEWSCFILAPHVEAKAFPKPVGLLD